MKFYSVTRKGKDLGRFPKAAFDEMIKNKLLPLDAHYWTEGMADWASIASISGATPPIPTPPKAPTATPAKVKATRVPLARSFFVFSWASVPWPSSS
jgi:hypothetical protein